MYELAKRVIPVNISPWRQQPMEETMKYRIKMLKNFWTWINQSGSKVFIAEMEQEKPAGFLVLYPNAVEELTGLPQGWVMDIAVLEDYRNHGIGRVLMEAAETYCREQGIEYLGLAVSSHNVQAVKLYQSLGFAEERKLMVKVLK
ncbi:GCN5-related N-acetyltransferase [Desulfitobacterium hafniense DCB-2]|nr:GCN5-related N-acetyltransferase [Desulfitobacterium hafniense DCB-2]CDX03056.1 Acetyltransferase [Desulfitobacterium hafniense]SHN81220.1 Acetyltransferase, GNAT family [Desulfitobacterium chlororespirans DSM 11544]